MTIADLDQPKVPDPTGSESDRFRIPAIPESDRFRIRPAPDLAGHGSDRIPIRHTSLSSYIEISVLGTRRVPSVPELCVAVAGSLQHEGGLRGEQGAEEHHPPRRAQAHLHGVGYNDFDVF